MKADPWESVADAVATRWGFRAVSTPVYGQGFCLDQSVSPSVQVFFQRITSTEVAPDAWLGVYVEEFEREWNERLARCPGASLISHPPLVFLAANVKQLQGRPWVSKDPGPEDIAAVDQWLDKVFRYAMTLPPDMSALLDGIRADNIGGHQLWGVSGHPVKVRGFAGWLRRRGDDVSAHLLRWLPTRTEPYDVNVMLDAPEREGLAGAI